MLALILVSCDNNKIYEKYQKIPNGVWKQSEPVAFDIDITDTLQTSDMIVQVRTTESYPYRNLYMFMNTTFPDGGTAADTLMFLLFDEKGKPLGDCTGKYCNARFWIDHNIRFPATGRYRFEFTQAMRTENGELPEIMNLGLRLEKSSGKP